MPVEIRQALTDADYEAWRQVRLAVLPGEQALAVAQLRAQDAPVRLLLLAFLDGELVGSGLADRSDTGQGFVAPRVIPACRGRGVGSALLAELVDHVSRHGFEKTSAHVNGADTAAVGFAERRGFVEVDREVEQVSRSAPTRRMGLTSPASSSPRSARDPSCSTPRTSSARRATPTSRSRWGRSTSRASSGSAMRRRFRVALSSRSQTARLSASRA